MCRLAMGKTGLSNANFVGPTPASNPPGSPLVHYEGEALKRQPKAKRESNPQRWSRLVSLAKGALEELEDMRSDYGDKFDAMNEGLKASAYGQRCERMQELDLQSAIETLEEAEGAEVPLGFGRD